MAKAPVRIEIEPDYSTAEGQDRQVSLWHHHTKWLTGRSGEEKMEYIPTKRLVPGDTLLLSFGSGKRTRQTRYKVVEGYTTGIILVREDAESEEE